MSTNFNTVIKMLQQDLDVLDAKQAELQTQREAIKDAISSLKLQTKDIGPVSAAPPKRRKRKNKRLIQIPSDVHRYVALYHIGRKQPITTADIARVYAAPYSGRMRKKVYTYMQKAQLTAMHTLVKEGYVFQRTGGAYTYTLTQKGVDMLKTEDVQRETAQAVLFVEERLRKVAAPAAA